MNQSRLERTAYQQIVDAGLPEPVREFRFHPVRGWRADFAWPEHKLLLEIEGGFGYKQRATTAKGTRTRNALRATSTNTTRPRYWDIGF